MRILLCICILLMIFSNTEVCFACNITKTPLFTVHFRAKTQAGAYLYDGWGNVLGRYVRYNNDGTNDDFSYYTPYTRDNNGHYQLYTGDIQWHFDYWQSVTGSIYTSCTYTPNISTVWDSLWPEPPTVAFYGTQADLQCAQMGPTNGGDGGGDDGDGGSNSSSCKTGSLPGYVGQPINIATGNMYHDETDLQFSDILELRRTYNSNGDINNNPSGYLPRFGSKWSFNFGTNISTIPGGKRILAPSGEWRRYMGSDSQGYVPRPGTNGSLTYTGSGYIETLFTGTKNYFDSQGRVTKIVLAAGQIITIDYTQSDFNYINVTDDFGRKIVLRLNSNGYIDEVRDPAYDPNFPTKHIYSYGYTGNNLTSVTFPDGTIKIYGYQSPDLLTSISINGQYLAQWGYNANGFCTSSSTDGLNNSVTLSYDTSSTTTVTDSKNNSSIYTYQHVNDGIIKTTNITGNCGCTGASASHDSSGNILQKIDKNNNKTNYYNYDTKRNPAKIDECDSVGNIKRTTTYTYHPVTSAPTSITRSSAIYSNHSSVTKYKYDSFNNMTGTVRTGYTKNISGAIIPFSYSSHQRFGWSKKVAESTDPLSHKVTFDYYSTTLGHINHGQLKSITNHLNHVSTFGNYSSGKAGRIRDANNILTHNIYDLRGRLKAVTVHNRTTQYGYDAFGNRTSMLLPKGNRIGYSYDTANRLEKVRDGKGNYIKHVYDTESNRTREEIHDSSGTLKKYQDMSYDDNNRLWKVTNPDGSYTESLYDGNGNRTTFKDNNGKTTTNRYDPLNRLTRVVQPPPKAGFANISTSYGYDINDNVTSIKDGRNNTTYYDYDDLGRLLENRSPDTNTTRYEYDAVGNLKYKQDAKNTLVSYDYDELNRLKAIHYPDTAQDISYTYDSTQVTYGIGRLTGMADQSGTTTYWYDEYGSVTKEVKTINGLAGTFTTEYGYNDNGNIESITYPDNRVVHYEYDEDEISRVWTEKPGTATKDIAANISHMPFGGITGYTYGNGLTAVRSYDNQYRLSYLKSGPFMKRNYGYDYNGNITGITDLVNSAKNQGFGYDAINRLSTATGSYGSLAYEYDAVGNRTQKTVGSAVTNYSIPTGSNMLSSLSGAESGSFGYDDNGNTTSDGTFIFAYNQNNRLIEATQGGNVKGSYVYDGLGRRVKKTASGVTTYFFYDLSGKLIAEYDGAGNWTNSRAYLNGEPLTRFDAGVQNPPNPSASPYETSACLTWDSVAGASYYIVCWGDVSGNYPNCSASVSETSYCVDGLSPNITWYFVIKAYDSGGNIIGQSDEVSARTEAGNPSLPHYSFNASLGGQTDCTVCHIQPGTFMQGFGVRTSVGICYSCHSEAGVGHDKPYRTGHPIYVNVTVDSSHKLPSLGSHTGIGSDTVNTHLLNGRQVVCMTCHNSKVKPNDPARSWEPTTTTDNMVYQLQNGAWNYDAYLKPVVYRDTSLWTGPTYLKDRKKYIVPESEYDVYPVQGSVVFHQAQPAEYYVYVTLGNDYLRNANINNQLCKDCHVTGSHKGADCTICHGTHNTDNLYNIRQKVGTPSGYKEIEYRNVSGLSGNKGACVVCHTTTMYHNATAILPIQHYDNQQCSDCHPHKSGFPSFTTVLRSFVRKLFAFFAGDVAYAGPPAWSGKSPTQLPPGLINHSLPAQAWENGLIRFNASVQIVRKPITTTATIKDDITYYYHNDHLGKPMFMSDEAGTKVWQREQMPFGEDTLLRGTITENLRMPGQYWDGEKNSSYNFKRDNYYPNLGRYGQADPIGLEGGPNLFIYTNNNPNKFTDPSGLAVCDLDCAKRVAKKVLQASLSAGVNGTRRDNTQWNAYLHCLWNCEMVKQCGWSTAFIAGTGHEIWDEDQSPYINNNSASNMDFHNNSEGRDCGSNNGNGCKEKKSCGKCCKEKLINGDLIYLVGHGASGGW